MIGYSPPSSSGSSGIAETLLDAKGDLIAASAADTAARLAVGTNLTHRLVANSAQTTGLQWLPHIVARTADSATRSATTTLANDDTLAFSIGASERWYFQAWLAITASSATGDIKFGWSLPASCTALWGAQSATIGVSNGAAFTLGGLATSPTALADQTGTVQAGVIAGTVGLSLAGWITNSTNAGTATLQWAQQTSDAATIKLLRDSMLLLWRIA